MPTGMSWDSLYNSYSRWGTDVSFLNYVFAEFGFIMGVTNKPESQRRSFPIIPPFSETALKPEVLILFFLQTLEI